MLIDKQFIANPYPTYREMLTADEPIWSEMFGGLWLISKYSHTSALLHDQRLSAARTDVLWLGFPPEDVARLEPLKRHINLWMIVRDGNGHRDLRRRLSKSFTPRAIESWRARIAERSNELIDAMIAAPDADGNIDLMHQFAYPLPAQVITELLGVSRDLEEQFIVWSDNITNFTGTSNATLEQAYLAQESMAEMVAYFQRVVADRRRQPADDLISTFIGGEAQDDLIPEEELLAQCVLFLFAAHETTRSLIGGGVRTLLDHPDQLALLRANPALSKSAVEEMVRYESPKQLVVRIATEDFDYHGAAIKKGHAIGFLFGAANRDPDQYPNPDVFDITRRDNRPMSFGDGPHICLGMALAYLETQIAIATLFDRLPNLRLTNTPPEWLDGFTFRGLRTLTLNPGVLTTVPA